MVPTKEMGSPAMVHNKRILTIQQLRKQLDFYNLLKKASKEISLNYDFHGVSCKGKEKEKEHRKKKANEVKLYYCNINGFTSKKSRLTKHY